MTARPVPATGVIFMCYDNHVWKFHRSAVRHGVAVEDVLHACGHAVVVEDFNPRPIRRSCCSSDGTGRLLEVIVLVLAEERMMAIYAMPLGTVFDKLLPPENPDA